MMYKLWKIVVQEDKKPFSYEKVSLIAEIDKATADKIYEKAMKHIHIGKNILWLCITEENQYKVPAKTYVLLEGYEW